ncbi:MULTISPECIES: ABC transporter ATP-binding protein [Rheinheimera]|uniref:ABC transporter ATP-binding protein n=1 Tax=Rheinheimera TaxID=67575 RepID=UPI00104E151A|nr:ABC transporter ATP-binding protein [Rheinheimera sp. D18]QBL10595.1 ABC transporter ATP-binding protein [Rheinheimera sp. D18]
MSQLCKTYRAGEIQTSALKSVDLEIHSNESLAITGASGGGKSTLLAVMGLLESFDSGRYLLNGIDVKQLSFDEACRIRNRYIGFVFQSFQLIESMSVQDNVMLPLRYGSKKPVAEQVDWVHFLLEQVGMSHRLTHRPSQLSGGQQQRVAIARALVMQPLLILADEPTGNLDSKTAVEIIDLLFKLQSFGATLVYVTHDSALAEQAQRIVQINDGETGVAGAISRR